MRAKDLTPLEGKHLIDTAKQRAIATANERQEPVATMSMIENLYEGVMGLPLDNFAAVNGWPIISETTWQEIALELLELVQLDNTLAGQEIDERTAYTKSLMTWMNYGFSVSTNHDMPGFPDYAVYGGEIEVEWRQ